MTGSSSTGNSQQIGSLLFGETGEISQFDKFWFDCLNGDSRETGKRTPDGRPDPSIFSTKYNRAGIRVGTAISLMARKGKNRQEPIVRFRHFWGVTKRKDLLESTNVQDFDNSYKVANPIESNRYFFRPLTIIPYYHAQSGYVHRTAIHHR